VPVVGERRAALILLLILCSVLVTLPKIASVGASSTMWSQTYGGPDNDLAEAMIQTSDGGYALAGHTSSFGASEGDAWLIKTNEYGVIPEFPSWTPLLIMLVVGVTVAVIYRRNLYKQNQGRRKQ